MGGRPTYVYREPRIITACRVEFRRLDQTVVAESEDLSRRGVFVRTESLLPVGDVIELAITLPDDDVVRVISRVAHLLAPSAARALGRRSGMGFEFLEHDNEGREQLTRYLEEVLEEVTPPPMSVPMSARVLVADPSGRILERLATTLGGDGFAVTTVTNGAEAYSACLDNPPDALLASADMPVMDGWTLVKMLVARPSLADVPVLLMSDDSSDMTRLKAYRLGVRDFVHRPFTDEEICIRLRRVVMAGGNARQTVVLRGDLSQIGLPTLLSLLEFERKSGILVVLRDDEAARLFVAGGRIVKVEGPGNEGTSHDRLMTVLDWANGNFEFAACEVVGTDEIDMSTSLLLLEHARMRDERDHGGEEESDVGPVELGVDVDVSDEEQL